MSWKEEIVDVFYGRHNRFEVVKARGKYYVYRDGEYWRGSFERRDTAALAALEESER